MNKRDMQQLKASIARDLVQGQNENSATRELLKQYVPLNGIISSPEGDTSPPQSVENCLAPHATVARGATNKNDDDDIKINHHQKAKKPKLPAILWKTTLARLRRQRKKLPNRIFCSCVKRMKKQPGTAGTNPIPTHTSKTTSEVCRRLKSFRS